MTRFASLWLPTWPTDRWLRRNPGHVFEPVALAAASQGGRRLSAVNTAAADGGVVPGVTVTEARALLPALIVGDADTQEDAADLHRLAGWCGRWTPRVAIDGDDGLLLDLTGCTHLFGGEGALLRDIETRLQRAGVGCRLGSAGTPTAAWAWARHRPPRSSPLLVPGDADALGRLPVASLRLPLTLSASLQRLGLRNIADLLRQPRAPLARRFGPELLDRLDRLTGARPDPITPLLPPPSWSARATLAEPIVDRDSIEVATTQLLAELCVALEGGGYGARSVTLTLYRVDATAQTLTVGAGAPTRDPRHLLRLFREPFETISARFGVEALKVEATATTPLAPEQWDTSRRDGLALDEMLDRARMRAGHRAALRFALVDTYIPERAVAHTPLDDQMPSSLWPETSARPLLLLSPPEPIVVDCSGDLDWRLDAIYWRRRRYSVHVAEGPERLRSEWWRGDPDATRDYYRVETAEGRRFWLFQRRGTTTRDGWFMHGLCA